MIPGLAAYRAADNAFAAWELTGLALHPDGTLALTPDSDGGEAIGPIQQTAAPFRELIASWNALTPTGTWTETLARINLDPESDRWTRWYSLGVWTSADGPVTRHSVARQDDAAARVATDVISLRAADAAHFQLAIRLHRHPGTAESPVVRALFAATSAPPHVPSAISRPTHTDLLVELPQCSQMIYPDGGNVWCSPTCVSMVLARWLKDASPCEPRVRAAVNGVYDHVYRGHGNWPFNTAYAFHAAHRPAWIQHAAEHAPAADLEAYVFRLPDLAAAEPWLAAGIPLVLSYGWRQGELTGAPIATSSGHLVVLAGFDRRGDPIIHDPAAPSNETVRRTYRRDQIERLWLSHSAGTTYAIHPAGHPTPLA